MTQYTSTQFPVDDCPFCRRGNCYQVVTEYPDPDPELAADDVIRLIVHNQAN